MMMMINQSSTYDDHSLHYRQWSRLLLLLLDSTVLLLRDSLIIGRECTCLHPIHSWKHHAMGPLAVRSIDRCSVENSFCAVVIILIITVIINTHHRHHQNHRSYLWVYRLFPSVWSSIEELVLRCFIYHFPLPLHTFQSQSLGRSGLVTPSFSTSTTTVGVMKHGLVIMRVKATEDSLSVKVSMCVHTTNRWVDSIALYLQSLG